MDYKDIKIVFFGTPEFAVASLDTLVEAGCNIAAVVTMPDKTGGRGNKIIQSDVKLAALRHGQPLLQPEKLKNEEFLEQLRTINADLFIVIAFRMLPREVWEMPRLGTFNLHGSLLPQYRGAAPINRAIMNGETRTGVTTFFLKHEIDTGDIIGRRSIEIGPDENFESVYNRLMKIGAEMTLQTVADIAQGNLRPIPQDELLGNCQPTPAPKIFKDDCRIDWNSNASSIHNHVRGLSPLPGAWCDFSLGGKDVTTIKILQTGLNATTDMNLAPGQLAMDGKKVFAGTADKPIELVTVQAAGKRPMPAPDWFRGLRAGENGRSPRLS